MTGKGGHPLRQMIIAGYDASSISVGAKVFTRVKRKGGGVSKSADELAFVSCKVGLGTVLNHPKLVLSGNRHDGIHVGRLTVKMNWNDAHSRRVDLSLDQSRIDGKGFIVSIAKDHFASGLSDRFRRRNPGMGRGDYFISRFKT